LVFTIKRKSHNYTVFVQLLLHFEYYWPLSWTNTFYYSCNKFGAIFTDIGLIFSKRLASVFAFVTTNLYYDLGLGGKRFDYS